MDTLPTTGSTILIDNKLCPFRVPLETLAPRELAAPLDLL